MTQSGWRLLTTVLVSALATASCADPAGTIVRPNLAPSDASYDLTQGGVSFSDFTPVAASTACTYGGDPVAPFILPSGFDQKIIGREGDGGTLDLWDMNTQNETGPSAGRYLYRSASYFSERGTNTVISATVPMHIRHLLDQRLVCARSPTAALSQRTNGSINAKSFARILGRSALSISPLDNERPSVKD